MFVRQKLAQKVDMSILTDEARKELLDFYLFLVERYSVRNIEKTDRFKNLISSPLKVGKIDIPLRESLYER